MPSVKTITSLPKFVSREEHVAIVASTPSSFTEIPPVLRHQEQCSIALDPPLEDFTAQDAASGTLYILTSVLVYMSTTGRGFQIEYPAITLHAVSRADGRPAIYCQLDENFGEENAAANSEVISDMRELSIVPQNTESLDLIFESLSICAALHPDKKTDSDDEDLDDAFIDPLSDGRFETFTGDEEQELSQVGRAALAHLESIIYDPFDHTAADQANGVDGDVDEDGQFEDSIDDQKKEVDELNANGTQGKGASVASTTTTTTTTTSAPTT